jgi:hypothetical protein
MRAGIQAGSKLGIGVLATLLVVGCSGPSAGGAAAGGATAASPGYVPGLGELMSLQQMRHIKLWFAGQAQNWPLATYEVDELGEGFDDVVHYHPTLGKKPLAPKDLIPQLVTEPLDSLKAAVGRGDLQAFDASYDALTSACNSCHQAMEFEFNKVQRPASNPYSNQVFARAQ